MWTWIGIGVGVFFILGAAVALVIASTLGVIADEIAGLGEAEEWALLPLTRETELPAEPEPEEGVLTA